MIQDVVQSFSAVLLPEHVHLQEISVFIHRNTSMIKEIGIMHLVKASLGKQETDMPLQLFTMHKCMTKTLYHLLLFFRKAVWICGIHCGEVRIPHGIFHTADVHGLFLIINLVQQKPVVHPELWPSSDKLALQFELDDGDGLMHFHIQIQILAVVILSVFDGKNAAVRILSLIHI